MAQLHKKFIDAQIKEPFAMPATYRRRKINRKPTSLILRTFSTAVR